MGLLLLSSSGVGINPADNPLVASEPAFSVTLTGYNAVPGQTDGDPTITANGGYADPEVVAARSRDLADELPFGTVIEVSRTADTDPNCGYEAVAPLIGYRVITDTMNARIKNHVDILFPVRTSLPGSGTAGNAARVLGSCAETTITVVGHIDLTHVSDLPSSQAELAALVAQGSNLALK